MKTKKAVSLVVLIITIVIMIILSGVIILSINDTNILDQSSETVGMQNLNTEKERLERVRGEVLMKTGGKITVDQYVATLVTKGIVTESQIITNEGGVKTIVTELGHSIIVEPQGKNNIKITVVGKEGQLPSSTNITYNTIWENGKAIITLIRPAGVSDKTKFEYSTDNGETYQETDERITDIQDGTTILVRLNSGSEVSKTQRITVKDNVLPQVEAALGTITESTIPVTVTAVENETGIKECRYYIKKNGDESYELKETQIVPTSYTYDGLEAETIYDIKVEVEDNAANVGIKEIAKVSTTEATPLINTVSISEETINSLKVTTTLTKGKNITYSYYYRIKGSGAEYTAFVENVASETQTITGLNANLTYEIQVVAKNAVGTDAKIAEGSTLPIPTAESNITHTNTVWSDGKATIIVTKSNTVDASLLMEYSIDGGKNYLPTTGNIPNIEDNTKVLVRFTDGKSSGEATEIIVEDKTLPQVTVVAGTPTEDTIPVTVTAIENETGIKEYRYYIKKNTDTTYSLKETTTAATYTYTGLEAETEYDIKVEVEDKSENTGYGTTAATTTKTKPVISQVSITEAKTNSLKVTVSLAKGKEVKYKYSYRVKGTTNYTTFSENVESTTEIITGLQDDTTYEIQVVATNTVGTNTKTAEGTTIQVPTAVGNITQKNTEWKDNKATITVAKVSSVDSNLTMEYSIDGGTNYTATTGSIPNLADKTVVLVRFTDGKNTGLPTEIKVEDTTLPQVTVVAGESTENTIPVTVTAVENETGIKEYRYYIKKKAETTYSLKTTNQSATYTYEGLEAETEYDIKVEVEDKSDNTGSGTTAATTSKAKPVISQVSISEEKTNSLKVTVTLSKGKEVKYKYSYRVKGTTNYTTFSENVESTTETITGLQDGKTYEIQVVATNTVGTNTKTAEGTTALVPTAESNITHTNTVWSDGKATITVTKSSSVDSNLTMEYSIDGGTNYTATTGSIANLADKTVVLVRLTDGKNAGEPIEIAVEDTTKPQVTVVAGEPTEDTIPVTVTAIENQTGIKEYRYYIKKKTESTYSLKETTTAATYTYTGLEAETNYDIKVEVEDKSDNTGSGTTAATTAKAKPVISQVSISEPKTNSLKVTVSLAKGKEVKYKYSYRVKGTTNYTTFSENVESTTETITGLQDDTTYEIQVVATNTVGTNTKTAEGTTALVPTAESNITHTNTVWSDGKATITVTKSSSVDSNLTMEYSIDGGTNYTATTGSIANLADKTVVLVRLTDGKNVGEPTEIIVEDKTKPQVTVVAGEPTEDTIPVTVTAIENETGIKEYRYYIKKKTETTYSLKTTNQSATYTYEGLEAETNYDIKVEVEDKSDNTGSGTTAATTSKAKPVISQVSISEEKTNSLKVTVSLAKGKEVKYKYSYRVKGTTNYTTFSENVESTTETITGLQDDTTYEIQVVATNTVGTNTKTAEGTTIQVPTAVGNISLKNTEWKDNKATITVTKSSSVDSNLTMEYSIDGGTNYTATTGSIPNLADKTVVLVRFTDGKNTGLPTEIIVEDTTLPQVTVVAGESTENTIPVTVTAVENETGIKEYRYYIKKKAESTYSLKATTQSATYTFTGLEAETNYDIKVEVEDKSDNTGNGTIVAATAKEKPVISTVTISEEKTNSLKVTVSLSKGKDVRYSYYYRVKGSGTDYVTFKANLTSTTQTITGLQDDTTYDIKVVVTNTVGTDTKTAEGTTIQVPTAEGNITHKNTTWTNGKGTITVAKVSTVDSNLTMEYSIDGGTSYESTTGVIEEIADGSTVLVRLTDGKNTGEPIEIAVEDKILPQVTVVKGTLTENTIPVTVTAIENETGIKEYRYYIKKKTESTYSLKITNQSATYTYEGLEAETEYDIKVEVEDNSDNTGSATLAATTTKAKPVISGVNVVETTTNSIKLTVTLSKGKDVTYSYYYKVQGSDVDYTLHNATATTASTYTLTGLQDATTYEIQVVATNTAGEYEAYSSGRTGEVVTAVGNISLKTIIWENGKAIVTVEKASTVPNALTMEYSIDDGKNYLPTTGTITGVETGTTVLVRLTDGINEGNTASIEVVDSVSPTLTVTTDYEENDKIPVSVAVVEKESGVNKVKYAAGTITEASAKSYFTSNGTTVSNGEFTIPRGDGTYTVYVEDNAGNYSIKALQITETLYAVYSATDTSLEFVRTHKTLTTGGTYKEKAATAVYTGFESATAYTAATQQPWYSYRKNITSVTVEDTISPKGTSYWFYEFTKCASLELTKLDTTNVTTMNSMFAYTGNATTVTTFKITGTDNWNTANVTDMYGMFREAGKNATTWDIGKLTNWNTAKVTTMRRMFPYAGQSATTFNIGNLDNWNVGKVTTMNDMFNSAGQKATTWNIGKLTSWNTANVTNMSSMFYYAGNKASTFDIGKLDNWNTSKSTSMEQMFCNAGNKASTFDIGNLDNWDVGKTKSMYYMFCDAGSSASYWNIGKLDNWNTGSVTHFTKMFSNAGQSATTFDIGNLDNWNTANVTNMSHMFAGAGKKSTTWNIGKLNNWNTANVTNMAYMFVNAAIANGSTFDIGDISGWNVLNVSTMQGMFSNAGQYNTKWYVGDLGKWNVSNVKNMSSMFSGTAMYGGEIDIGNLGSWKTTNVTDISSIFSETGMYATKVNIGDISSWDVSNVTNMYHMFYSFARGATTFNIGDISKWNTGNVTNMEGMFFYAGQKATYSLNLSNWNVENVTSYSGFNTAVTSKVTPPNFK